MIQLKRFMFFIILFIIIILFYYVNDYSTLQMLTTIENRLEELLEEIEMMPRDLIDEASRVSKSIL